MSTCPKEAVATPGAAMDEGAVARTDKPKKPGIGLHYLRYSLGSVLTMIAGLVSFPVLTRLLDNTQYGILGYYNTWVLAAIAFAKLGGQHSIIRFYPHHGGQEAYARFSTNLVLVPMALSFGMWALAALGLLGAQVFAGAEPSSVLWCVVLLTPVLVMGSFVQMVVRASERSGLVMVTRVAGKYLEIGMVLLFVIAIERSALAVFEGRLVAGAALLAYFVYWSFRNLRFSPRAFDFAETRQALHYGLPMMVNEFAAMALVAIDRVILKHLTGDFAAVGIYTVGYALAMQINLFLNAALSEAFSPVVSRVYVTEGEAAVRALKARMLKPITYAAVGIAAAVLGLGHEAIVGLAGQDKSASGEVFVIVGAVMALYPVFDISAYGLLLKKRSLTVLMITAGATILNVAINFALIPRFGYMGAAWATLLSYVALWLAYMVWCPRGLLQLPDLRTVATALLAAGAFLAVLEGGSLSSLDGAWPRLFAGGALFLLLYALPVWLLDPRLRAMALEWRRKRS